jgi:hypothetical protein
MDENRRAEPVDFLQQLHDETEVPVITETFFRAV